MNRNSTETVLVTDDDPSIREALLKVLTKEGYNVLLAEDGKKAFDILDRENIGVILTDLRMPGMDGLELLRNVKLVSSEVAVILISGQGTIEEAVEAMKNGAYDFITKPLKRLDVIKAVKKALEHRTLVLENRYLRQQLNDSRALSNIIGNSKGLREILDMVIQVAPTSATVLILGESGTGKELIANAIHYYSRRSEKPLIKVSCAALPETLLEAELFGYERGAFTGATTKKEGRFELADGGTIFLDEIGQMNPTVQVKLLRVLQEREFERLGGTKTLKVDVRLVAATNMNLAESIQNKTFREDLYYRLNVVAISIPPLRDRKEDIPLLVDHFLRTYNEKNGKKISGISQQAMYLLMEYNWPGNVREIENTIERAVVLARKDVIQPENLPSNISSIQTDKSAITIQIGTPLETIEKKIIRETLRHTKEDKTKAARMLGISSRTIYRKLEQYELNKI